MGVTVSGIDDLIEEVDSVVYDTTAKMMTRIDTRIQDRNPVYSGNMANSWAASRNTPKRLTPTTSKNPRKRRPNIVTAEKAFSLNVSTRIKRNTRSMFLVNATSYSYKVWENADGHSDKAPPKWGEIIVASEVSRANR